MSSLNLSIYCDEKWSPGGLVMLGRGKKGLLFGWEAAPLVVSKK
jgi:hypothetical protein